MRSQALFCALAALVAGCETRRVEEPAPMNLGGELHVCGKYAGVPNALGYCIYKHAERLGNPDEVNRVCALAGTWEGECRRAWVSGHRGFNSGYSTEQLIAACGSFDDCTFELIDMRPSATIDGQIELCTDAAGDFRNDCVVHALERWWRARPDAGEVARVASFHTIYPQQIGYYTGAAVACQGSGSCVGDPEVSVACERSAAQFREEPSRCPSAELQPKGQREGEQR